MDYTNFSALLPVKVTFSKHELQPISSKGSSKEQNGRERLNSNFSDIVDQNE